MRGFPAYRALAVGLVFVALVHFLAQTLPVLRGRRLQDFRTYYYAATAHRRGLSPYDLSALRKVAGRHEVHLPFVYPPHFLALFAPLARMGYWHAYYLFLALKLLALGALLWLWSRIVPTARADLWPLLVTAALGCGSALLKDLKSGNVSTFEQLLLWAGIYLLLRRRTLLGGASVLLSSMFKLATAPLGLLVPLIRRSTGAVSVWLALCLATGLAYLALYAAQPQLWADFLSSVRTLDDRGGNCPSSLAFLGDVARAAGAGPAAAYVAYALVGCLVLSAWLWAVWRSRGWQDPYARIHVTILAYVLVVPRVKDYSLVLVLLPALHIISALFGARRRAALWCLLLWAPFFDYQPLLLSACLFMALLRWISRSGSMPGAGLELTLNPLRGFRAAGP